MTNIEKYKDCFTKALELASAENLESLEYQSVPAWDSVGHIRLITLVEETFGIMLDTEDVVDFSSFEYGKEVLKKYGVELAR